MRVLLHIVTYASVLIFILAVIVRFLRIQTYPLHLRWELYPVPHEGKRAKHGGSKMEEVDWWEKPVRPHRISELKFMLTEMLFLKALYEHNRTLWYRSFPFHFGLYMVAGMVGLLFLGALLELAGVPVGADAGGVGTFLTIFTVLTGVLGLCLGIFGAFGLLYVRLADDEIRPYSSFSHLFNLVFILLALGLTFVSLLIVDRDLYFFRGYVSSLLTFDLSFETGNLLVNLSLLTLSLLLAYIPLTHMSHFFVKWFTWHKIRWDDEPNVKGGRIDRMIQKALSYPVSWSADHVNADGKKNWATIATEGIEERDEKD